MSHLNIIFLADSKDDVQTIRTLFGEENISINLIHFNSRNDFVSHLKKQRPDIILADYSISSFKRHEILEIVQEKYEDLPVIYISDLAGEEPAIEALKRGATDYIQKQRMVRLIPSVRRTLLEVSEKEKRIHAEKLKHKYDFIVNASRSMFTLVDRNYTYEAVNDAFCRAHNLVREEIIGKKLEELWGKEVFKKFIKQNVDKSFTDHVVRYQSWFGVPDAGLRCFEVTFYPYKEHGSEVTHTVVDTMDITDRQKAEDELRESESRYRMLFERASEAILLVQEGRIKTCNLKTTEIFGDKRETIINRSILDYSPDVQPEGSKSEKLLKSYIDKARKGEAQQFEWNIKRPDKSIVETNISLAFFELKGEQFFQFFIDDVTEKTKLQNYLQRAQRMETVGTLAGGIAHDFNNILATILGHTDIALQDIDKDHSSYFDLEQIKKATFRAKELVQQILSFSRPIEKKVVAVDMISHIEEALKMLSASIPGNIKVHTDLDKKCPPVHADPSHIHQVIMNICTNALHAMHKGGGELTIKLACLKIDESMIKNYPDLVPGKYIRADFRDTGVGMDKETVNRIFEPFYTTKSVGEGTGLGLSVVHGIINNLGGEILVESKPGEGSVFSIILPSSK